MAQGVRRPAAQVAALGALAAALAAQGSQPASAPARIEAVLARCHGVLRGTMDRVLLELRAAEDGPATSVLLLWPARMRVRDPDGKLAFLAPDQPAPAELARLRDLLGMLLLQPLVAAERSEAVDGGRVRITAGGAVYELTLDRDARPTALRGPAGEVQFLEHIETGITVLPRRVRLGPLGERTVRFLGTGVTALDEAFTARTAREPADVVRVTSDPDDGRGPRAATLLALEARQWLVRADPTDWRKRAEVLDDAGRMLHERGQRPHGLPAYWSVGGKPSLAIPFRARAEKAFVPGTETVLAMPAHRAAVIVTPPLPFARALEHGSAQLADLLQREGKAATGPLRVIPFLHPTSAPTATELEAVELRLELPVEAWR